MPLVVLVTFGRSVAVTLQAIQQLWHPFVNDAHLPVSSDLHVFS